MFQRLKRESSVRISLIFIAGWLCALSIQAEDIVLKNGRIFNDAEIVSQSSLSVLIRSSEGATSVPKTLLPDALAQLYPIDQKAASAAKALTEKIALEAKAKEQSRSKLQEDASRGETDAQFALGEMYFSGEGGAKDFVQAVKWYAQAAEQGDQRAQYKLGRMYDTGEGVSRDFREAARWYHKAADQGNVEAAAFLGVLYEKGLGVAKEPIEAAKWFRVGAERGSVGCQKKMASVYLKGEGVPRDDIEALAWINVAAASGDYESKGLVDYFATPGRSSPSILLIAQQRSREIFARIAANEGRRTNIVSKSKIAPPEAALAKGNGSGVIVTASGYIITAAHVLANTSKVTVVTAQGSRSAKVIRLDEINDVALLKIEGGTYRALPVTPSKQVRLGQTVATIGFPVVDIQGFSPKVTRGEISSLNGAGDDPRSWQISVPVQPGNSGGPLLDENGNVVGLVVSRLMGGAVQNVNYAVKSAYLLALLEPYLESKTPVLDSSTPPPRFEDMIAKAQQSTVLILVY